MGQWLFSGELDTASRSCFNHQHIIAVKVKPVGFLLPGQLFVIVVVRVFGLKYKMLASLMRDLGLNSSTEKPMTPSCIYTGLLPTCWKPAGAEIVTQAEPPGQGTLKSSLPA